MCPLISPASAAPVSFSLALISECPVFHIIGTPPASRIALREVLRGLHVEDDPRAGLALEHIGGEQDQLPIGIDDLAVLRDDAQAIAITVEREAELGIGRRDGANQVGEILRLARVGMVIREVAVDLRIELTHVAAERAQDAGRRRAGNAVARVDGNLHPASELAIARRCGALYSGRMSIAAQRPLPFA